MQSSDKCQLAYASDEDEPKGTSDTSDCADSGGQGGKDMTEALPPPPQILSEYLELNDKLCYLFNVPDCLLIRSSYRTLHETLMRRLQLRKLEVRDMRL